MFCLITASFTSKVNFDLFSGGHFIYIYIFFLPSLVKDFHSCFSATPPITISHACHREHKIWDMRQAQTSIPTDDLKTLSKHTLISTSETAASCLNRFYPNSMAKP